MGYIVVFVVCASVDGKKLKKNLEPDVALE